MKNVLQAIAIASFILAGAMAQADEVILFKCFFDWKCDPNTKCDHASLDLRIKHNTDTNEAEFLGKHGSPLDTIGVHIGDRSVSFLAYQISGAVDVTTIALMNGEATHSSHRIGGITMKPEQYVGECVALPSSE
ncbi:hypothetical protein [Aliiruegeria lutimaris]|uniref:Uncharacterized protein n=1 Tax=Aliiruegeria lutimaris TaxID=571298 RepID=A0A1G8W8A6_9RHOB|nr:hypothetical protein [Aliiruegeria lutimaris]SDJ73965.1 hypothetical protein SAMN04488026_102332 [Aliiruegeria lutimaris]